MINIELARQYLRLMGLKPMLLCLVVFTLPMYMRINNILLGVFLALGLLDFILRPKNYRLKDLTIGWPFLLLFLLSVLASFNGASFLEGLGHLEKHLSLILVPLVLLVTKDKYNGLRDMVFFCLVLGCAATLLICYLHLIFEMISQNEPLSYFFRWRHLGHQFTDIADSHPTYLALFTVMSIMYLIQNKELGIKLKCFLLGFLLLGLFQLASRMALALISLFLLVSVVQKVRNYSRLALLLGTGIVLCILIYNKWGSDYLQNRLFSKEAIFNDERFQRWEVSYDIFKENPIIGLGHERIDEVRSEKYFEAGFDLAGRNSLNAHNQMLEYLSRNGAIGGFIYVLVVGYLLLLSILRKDTLFVFFLYRIHLGKSNRVYDG